MLALFLGGNTSLKKILITLVLLFTPSVMATELYEITLPDAIEYVKQNSPKLMISKMDVEIAKNNIKQANRLQNPSVISATNISKAGDGNPQQLVVSELIEIAKRHPRKKLAQSIYELTKRNLERSKFDLCMNVRDAYIDLVGAKTILKVVGEQQNLISDLKYLAEKKHAQGLTSEMDIFQTKIALNQLEIQKNSALVNVNNSITELNRAIYRKDADYDSTNGVYSDNYTALMVPEPTVQLPALEELLATYLDECFDVKIAKQQIEVAERDLTNVIRKRVPDVALTGGWEYQEKHRSASGAFYSGGFAGISLVNIPLLYAYKPEINNAKIALEQANLKYNSEVNETVKNIASAYDSFNTAKANLNEYNNQLLGDSFVLMKYAKENYEAGKSDLISLIVMEKCYKDINIGYTLALVQYSKAWTNLLRALNIDKMKEVETL